MEEGKGGHTFSLLRFSGKEKSPASKPWTVFAVALDLGDRGSMFTSGETPVG